jgi:hypothetical protein
MRIRIVVLDNNVKDKCPVPVVERGRGGEGYKTNHILVTN